MNTSRPDAGELLNCAGYLLDQSRVSTVFIPGVRCHPLDPSQVPAFSPSILQPTMSCKTIFDCTVPFGLKTSFQRCKFKEVDVTRFLPGFK
jgi:4-hydroxy-3-polyprenylbenzoate decarboxylase